MARFDDEIGQSLPPVEIDAEFFETNFGAEASRDVPVTASLTCSQCKFWLQDDPVNFNWFVGQCRKKTKTIEGFENIPIHPFQNGKSNICPQFEAFLF